MYYIYEIYNKITGRKYIGMTTNHIKRFETHMYSLERGEHTEKLMQRDYVLYGRESFEYRLLEYQASKTKAHDREKHYMNINKTFLEDYGYNCQDPVFIKYQMIGESVNSQNFFYKKIKETGLPLNKFAQMIGCSRKSLIHGITHPGSMKANTFCKMINLLNLDKTEAARFVGWLTSDKRVKPDFLLDFNKLSDENQDLVIQIMKSMLAKGS